MTRLKGLIFDVDGTLAETEELHRRAFNAAFAEFGLNWHWDRALYRELLTTTGGKERIRAFLAGHVLAMRPRDRDIPAIHARKTQRYVDLVAQGALALRPGIADLIADARAHGLRVAVATTTNLPNVEALSRACFGRPAAQVFDAIAAGDEVAAKKPAPDVFQLALDRLGLPAADCVAFEDSRNGLLAAQGAGLACVVSPGPYTVGQDFTGAAAVVRCFSDISDIARLGAAVSVDA